MAERFAVIRYVYYDDKENESYCAFDTKYGLHVEFTCAGSQKAAQVFVDELNSGLENVKEYFDPNTGDNIPAKD